MAGNRVYPVEGTLALAPQEQGARVVAIQREHRATTLEHAAAPQVRKRSSAWLAVVTSAMLLVAAVSLALDLSRTAASVTALGAAPTEVVVVCAGDSLWSIAQQHGMQGTTTQDVVSWIRESNDLTTSALTPGQRLVVPAP